MTSTEWRDLWQCPIMPAKSFVEVMGLSASGGKKFLEASAARIVTVGGIDFVFPIEISHGARAWK